MSKELWGGGPTKEEKEREEYVERVKPVVFKAMKNTYGLEFDSLYIVDKDSVIMSSSFSKRPLSAFILKDNLINFRFILNQVDDKLEIPLEHHIYFHSEYAKFMTIFKTLFRETNFTYLVNASTTFKFDNFLYNFVSPTIKPFGECIRVVGRDPYIKSLNSKHEMMYGDLRFDCMLGSELEYFNKFLSQINKMLYTEESQYIVAEDSVEIIENKLAVAEMIMY
jgi:hypothetical protein